MKRKIGEIFEYKGEWYQCVECNNDECRGCPFNGNCSIDVVGYCGSSYRSDGKTVIFKKLEKVGAPVKINGALMQKMKTPVAIGCEQCVLNNNGCSIAYEKCFSNELYVMEQNQEDMEEKKLNLKEFDLEAAKSGKPVCTRDGRKARIICFDAKGDKPIIALVEAKGNKDALIEEVERYFINGHSVFEVRGTNNDLMMLPEKHEGWINVYKEENCNNEYFTEKVIYKTRKSAFDNAYPKGYVTTVKIVWEE